MEQSLQEELKRTISSGSAGSKTPWYDSRGAEADSLRERAKQQRGIREAEMARQEAAFRTTLQRRKEAEERARDARLGALLSDVMSGLTAADSPLLEADSALEHADKVQRRKKEALHGEWSAAVYDTIQGRLQAAVDARDPRAIEARLKGQYDQYLHTTNTKVGVFRDVIIEKDYNPLAAAESAIRIPTGDIRDPLKRDVLKGEYERRLMSSGSSGLAASGSLTARSTSAGSQGGPRLGKETLDTKQWGELAIEATPFGHCTDGKGAYVVRPQSGGAAKLRTSHIPMDHYNFPRGNEAATDGAPPTGKKQVPGPEQRRGRADLFDVMHSTCHLKPEGYTGGDQWLEARGKGHAPGPEHRRGRRDLGDVMNQSVLAEGVPASTFGQARPPLGDAWLDAKGKLRPEGPEARRGRAGLYETIQQTSNPYAGGAKGGDAWLEAKGRRFFPALAPPEAGAALAGVPAAPVVRRPADERKFASHLVVLEAQVTASQ